LPGEPSDFEGDHVILQVTASPPITSTAKRPQSVRVVFDSREYTDNGQRTTHPTRTNAFRFAGFRFHPEAFPKCLESKLETVGPSACPKASRLGKGYAITDARPTVPDPIRANALVFNGTYDVDSEGNKVTPVPAILVYAETAGGLKAYIPAPFKGKDGFITAERSQPASGEQSPYTITAVHLTLPAKARKVNGRTVGFREAPGRAGEACGGSPRSTGSSLRPGSRRPTSVEPRPTPRPAGRDRASTRTRTEPL
jgi:hypothetical protein